MNIWPSKNIYVIIIICNKHNNKNNNKNNNNKNNNSNKNNIHLYSADSILICSSALKTFQSQIPSNPIQ